MPNIQKETNNSLIYTVTVEAASAGQRIDSLLASQLPKYSRTFFQRLIDKGLVTVNNKPCKASYAVKANDTITIEIPPARYVPQVLSKKAQEAVEQLPITIIHEEPEFIIINKPAGLIVHKPSASSEAITLVDWLLYRYPELADVGNEQRPGIVHRLDKDTSGLMIIAKTPFAHKTFSDMFKNRAIKKTYRAVVEGHPKKKGSIDLAIGRDVFQPTNEAQRAN
jgi:23S rRNA pseudouridine1911/1915/1917 synthase